MLKTKQCCRQLFRGNFRLYIWKLKDGHLVEKGAEFPL